MAESQRPLHGMREYVRSFSLDNLPHGNQGYRRVLLQLMGIIGYGKSSLINSCKCVLDDKKFHMYARATDSIGADTLYRTAYELTPTITIVDNRPLAHMSEEEMAEMYAQLGNFRPLNTIVSKKWPFDEFMSTLEDTDLKPNYTDLIVPVFVYSAKHTLALPHDQKTIQSFLRDARLMTGFTPIVVITHKAEQTTSGIENIFRVMGAEQIISVENYTTKNHERSRGRDTDILTFLYNTLQDVTFHMSYQQDPRRERVERKTFLLNYIDNVHAKNKVHEAIVKKNSNL